VNYANANEFYAAAWAALAAVGSGRRRAAQLHDWLATVQVRGREIYRELGQDIYGIARAAEDAARQREKTKGDDGGEA